MWGRVTLCARTEKVAWSKDWASLEQRHCELGHFRWYWERGCSHRGSAAGRELGAELLGLEGGSVFWTPI